MYRNDVFICKHELTESIRVASRASDVKALQVLVAVCRMYA